MSNRILIFLLLFSTIVSCFSQEPEKWEYSYTYRYFGVRDGLVQTQALLSFQDSYGYLWISTYDGVSRLDGLRFDNFSREDLHISSRIKHFGQYESAVYMLSRSNIIFVYPDRTIEYYPLPESSLQLSLDYIAEVAVVGSDFYIFNCQSPTQSNMDRFSLLRFNLKTKAFTMLAENLPYLRANISGQKVYAITCKEIKNQSLTLYRLNDDRLHAVRTIPMEKTDFSIDFKRTNRNEWFAVLVKSSSPSSLTRYLYQCFIENDSIRRDYLGAFSTEDGIYQCSRVFFESYQLDLGRNDDIVGVIKDSHGNVWFSSYTYGLWKADVQEYLHLRSVLSISYPLTATVIGNCD